jgi:hypothetical protein
MVTPAGARNRITALFARGWSPQTLAAETGLPKAVFRARACDFARADTQALHVIGRLYDRLWNVEPPRRTARERAVADQFAAHARNVGWAPPMAWDDDEIDRSDGEPAPGWQRPGDRRNSRQAELIEDIAWLRSAGYRTATNAELAMRLGKTREAVSTALRRDAARRSRAAAAIELEAG